MTEFTKEFIESQLEKWHSSTNDEWLTECWNNYGLALEEIKRLQARVQELEQEKAGILSVLGEVVGEAILKNPFSDASGMAILHGANLLLNSRYPQRPQQQKDGK